MAFYPAILPLVTLLCLGLTASAEPIRFAAKDGRDQRQLVIYSSLDDDLAAVLIGAYQADNPDVTVTYENLLTGEIFDRVSGETDAGRPTADFVFSSAMDLQVKLANDGYGAAVVTPDSVSWPTWAKWRDTAYALTYEPAVFAYHKPSFRDQLPPATRADLVRWVTENPVQAQGRVGTYDVMRSGVGYLFLARDQDLYPEIWQVIEAMGGAGLQQFSTSAELLERISDGRLAVGYNLLGSYAADWARRQPNIGLILPKDFTVVVSRVALVPTAARNPEMGADFLAYLMTPKGQALLARTLRLSVISLEVAGQNALGGELQDLTDVRLRPVPVSPGLLSYLDRATRAKLLGRWQDALTQD